MFHNGHIIGDEFPMIDGCRLFHFNIGDIGYSYDTENGKASMQYDFLSRAPSNNFSYGTENGKASMQFVTIGKCSRGTGLRYRER